MEPRCSHSTQDNANITHQLHIDSPCEIVACKFDQNDNPLVIILCSVYRPPSSNIEFLDHMCKEIYIVLHLLTPTQ